MIESANEQRAVAKARKILRLIDGAKSEGEAAAAALALQRLLASSGLAIEEVRSDERPEASWSCTDHRSSLSRWESNLAVTVARNLRCGVMYSPCTILGKSRVRLAFCGMEDDARIAKETYTSLRRAALACLARYAKELRDGGRLRGKVPTAVRNSYLLGFVAGLGDAFSDQVEASEELALAVSVPAAVTAAIDERTHGNVRRCGRMTVSIDPEFRERGRHDGETVGGRRGLDG